MDPHRACAGHIKYILRSALFTTACEQATVPSRSSSCVSLTDREFRAEGATVG